ncbi:MAG: hypothetical protein K6A73_04645, partial [Bacteroidales bacterium]|nr:hypothetical protein [Bacteroidales bacterium]
IFNDNYHKLLLSEALYKTDNPQDGFVETHGRASLQAAMQYFDSLAAQYPADDDLAVLSARSHYMNGVGFYENDSIIEACKEYLHTLEIMENHFDVEKVRGYKAKFMGLTYNRLVDLFSNQFMMEPAIYCGKKALFYCKIIPTSKYGLANSLYQLGNIYEMSNITDSANFYYKQAIEALPDSNNLVFRNIISSKALLAYNSGCDADSLIVELKQITKHIDNIDEISTRFIIIGYIYYKEKVYDSAVIYLEKAFDNNITIAAKHQSAEYLYNLNLQNGDSAKAYKYANFLAENATRQYDNMPEISALNSIFQDYLIQKQIKDKNDNKTTLYIYVIVVVIIVLIIGLITKLKANKKAQLSKQKIKELEQDIQKNKNRVVQLKKELGIKYNSSALRRDAFLNEPVCKQICSELVDLNISARDNYYQFHIDLPDDTMAELHKAVLKHSEKFDDILLDKCPQLKQNDLYLCYLLLLGLDEKQVGIVKKRSYSAITKQINKIEMLLKTDKSLSEYLSKVF